MIANILWDDFVDVHIGQTLPLEHLHEAIVGDRVFSEIIIRRFTKPQKTYNGLGQAGCRKMQKQNLTFKPYRILLTSFIIIVDHCWSSLMPRFMAEWWSNNNMTVLVMFGFTY